MSSEENAQKSTAQAELWKDWNETTARMWPSIFECGKEAYRASFGLYHFWMRSAGMAWGPFLTSPSRITDPLEVWQQCAEMTFDTWRTTIEASTSAVRAFYSLNEEPVQHFQLPTRSEKTHIEGLIVSLEERVYTIEDAVVSFEDGYLKIATDQVVEGLVGHLERLEGKLDTLDALASILQQNEMREDLAGRLERVEDKLNILLVALEKIEARAYPEGIASSNDGEAHHKNTKEA